MYEHCYRQFTLWWPHYILIQPPYHLIKKVRCSTAGLAAVIAQSYILVIFSLEILFLDIFFKKRRSSLLLKA